MEDLNNAAFEYADKERYQDPEIYNIVDAFKAGAKWQSKQVWHKGNEPADEDKEILFEWESLGEKYHDVGFYDKKAKVACVINGGRLVLSPEDRWAYLEDLVDL